jgi:hypothetical protein
MKRAGGRPKGEGSTVINVRVPGALMHRLARSLDMLETTTGLRTNRGAILRHALKGFRESKGMERVSRSDKVRGRMPAQWHAYMGRL